MKVRLKMRPDIPLIRDLIRNSWVYVIQHMFGRVYDHIDVVMLSLMCSFQQVTWYSAARRILEGLWMIPNIITEAVYPELNARFLVSHRLVQKLFDRSMKYMLVVGVIVSLGTVVIARTLIALIYQPALEPAGLVLILLGAAVVPSFLRYLFGTTLIAMNHQRIVNLVAMGKSFLNILLNLVGIALYQYKGATIATVMTEYITLFTYCWILYRKDLLHAYQLSFILKPLAAAAVLVGLYLLFPIHPIAAFISGIALYILFLLVAREFDGEEVALFKDHVIRRFLPGKGEG
jgi:O-antigen/teichoic acid export membrane protein